MESPTVIIDCHGVGYASRTAYGSLSYGGMPTSVIYGFLNRILGFVRNFQTRDLVFAWDSGRSFRKDLYPMYKKKDIEFSPEEYQEYIETKKLFATLRIKILPFLGFNNVYIQTGMEADDIMASVVYNNRGEMIIATDDKDLYQLLDHCTMYKLRQKKLYTVANLDKEWGVTPKEWIEVKRLAGCNGDNVPNIPRVREKTAIKYMRGKLKGDKAVLISQFIAEKKFLDRNSKLTKLPFEGTDKIKLVQQQPLEMIKIMNVCSKYGLDSLMKGNNLEAWNFLCKGEE
jgi:DNA polymerase-1